MVFFLHFQAVGGNIMTASPISDLNPLLMASGCTLTIASLGISVFLISFITSAKEVMFCQFLFDCLSVCLSLC